MLNISQGSAATRFRHAGIVNDELFITNLLLSLAVNEFWKSVNIWRSYMKEHRDIFTNGTFFLRHPDMWRHADTISAAAVGRFESERRPSVGWITAILCGWIVRLADVVRTGLNNVAVPVAVVLHNVDDVITVRVHKLRPRLPQRMYDIVDETDLHNRNDRWFTKTKKLKRYNNN